VATSDKTVMTERFKDGLEGAPHRRPSLGACGSPGRWLALARSRRIGLLIVTRATWRPIGTRGPRRHDPQAGEERRRVDAHNADLGSLSPVVVPGGYVFIAGKSGIGYVLHQGALGGIGGEVSSTSVCAGFGGAAPERGDHLRAVLKRSADGSDRRKRHDQPRLADHVGGDRVAGDRGWGRLELGHRCR
jgi:hypothetical protein